MAKKRFREVWEEVFRQFDDNELRTMLIHTDSLMKNRCLAGVCRGL